MRITNNLASTAAANGLAALREQIAATQRQITSGKRFETPSQDPVASQQALRNDRESRALAQYRRTIAAARSRTDLEDNALQNLTNLLTRAREIAIQQGDDSANATSRQQAVTEVNGLLSEAVALATVRDGEEYVFGGQQSTTPPYTITEGTIFTFSTTGGGPVGTRAVEIGAGETMVPVHDGVSVFGTTSGGVLKTLQDLATALNTGDRAQVTSQLSGLTAAQVGLQQQVADTGARGSRLDIADANLSAFATQLSARTSALRDVDMEAATTELVTRQTTYQAAMAATSRVLTMSLTDYLK
ncbi:MAG: flagellar hook-associated protein FlgL [Gemmatimonadetes bacterium]|nr:flagellar hook-associated protein FlgL [Gemmatimonadota bacterium]